MTGVNVGGSVLRRGTRVGHWVLERPLGDGASASVWLAKSASGEASKVARGSGWSVQDLLARGIARTGSRAVPTEDPALVRPVDVPVLIGDSRKLQHATGWRARRSLDDIIEDLLLHAATF